MITPLVAQLTRWLQQRFPGRPLPGLFRLSRLLPSYTGTIRLPNAVHWSIDPSLSAHREILYSGIYQPALVNALHPYIRPGAYCLDVGANVGYFALDFAMHVGPTGRVVALEANPALAAGIQTLADINRYPHLQVVSQAAYHTSGYTMTFYISRYEGKSSLSADLVTERIHDITVTTVALDDFITEQGWQRLDVIKLDIEGADLDALMGATNSIRRFLPVIAFEYKHGADPQRQHQVKDLLDELAYNLEVITLKGRRYAFDWTVPDALDHVDVLCLPPDGLHRR